MLRPLIQFIIKLIFILLVSITVGLMFGFLPCYVFPWFGADYRDWCGFKSEPPHFIFQFWLGFILAALVSSYFFYRSRR